MQKTFFVVFTLLFLCFYESLAQQLEAGVGLGFTNYRGDLNPNYSPLTSRPGGNILLRYNFSRGFSVKGDFTAGYLAGNDKYSSNQLNKVRGYNFKGFIYETALLLEYNFFNFRSYGTIYKSDWTPTLAFGMGGFSMINREFTGNGRTVPVASIKFADPVLIYGVGLKRQITSTLNLSINVGARMRFQKEYRDLIDGMGYKNSGIPSVDYPDHGSNTTLLNYFYLPNTKSADRYFYTGFTLSYVLYGLNCPNPKK